MTTEALLAAADAIRDGDVQVLRDLLARESGLEVGRLRGADGGRTLLHVATDWPGHRPRVAEIIAVLVAAGADVDAPFEGSHAETPLHWAASSDDVAAVDALLDAGAAIDAPGGSVGDGTGTPLFDATVFAQWSAAQRLLERGAQTGGWEEASLGLADRLAGRLSSRPSSPRELDAWLWAACHGGRQEAAALLLTAGGDRDRASDWDGLTPLDAARRGAESGTPGCAGVVSWLVAQGARTAER
jgi:hypothetical protein